MKLRRIAQGVLPLVVVAALVTACGSSGSSESDTAGSNSGADTQTAEEPSAGASAGNSSEESAATPPESEESNSESSAEGGDGKTINIGYFPVVSPVPFMQNQNLIGQQGYDVNWVEVSNGLPGAASALAAGKLDMVFGNANSGTIIFSQSPDVAQFVGQSFTNENITVASNDIKSIEDLAGQKVVVSGMKTASTLFYQMGLKKHGIDPESNEYFVAGTGPGMIGVMASGGATVAGTYVPYAAEMVLKGLGHVIFTADDALGSPAPGDGFVASKKIIEDRPDAVKAVLKAQFEATDFIKNQPDIAYDVLAKFAGVDKEAVAKSFESGMIGFADSYVPDSEGVAKVMEVADELGFTPDGVDDLPGFAKKFVNTDLAKQALSEK